MSADRRVDPASDVRVGDQRLVERLAHAVQPLELIAFDAARLLDHARDGERVVGRKLRIEMRPSGEQLGHASHVVEIGHRLAGEHGVVGKPALLRALHLGVPVGTLHQAHHQAAIERTRGIVHPVDHRGRALLIGLHRKPEAVPTGERGIGQHRADHVERQFEPVRLLGVDGEIEIMLLRLAGKLEHARVQLAQHAVMRGRLIARMQRGQFHRDAGPVG